MLRKVTFTGLLIFVSRGTIFQIIITALMCLGFGTASAWFEPYAEPAANLFKVATETSLLVTIILSVLLKVRLCCLYTARKRLIIIMTPAVPPSYITARG